MSVQCGEIRHYVYKVFVALQRPLSTVTSQRVPCCEVAQLLLLVRFAGQLRWTAVSCLRDTPRVCDRVFLRL